VPELKRLSCALEVPCDLSVVHRRDEEPLPFAGAIPQLVRLARALDRADRLSDIAVLETERRIRHRELRIELDCVSQERYSGGVSIGQPKPEARAVGFPGFE
jgi:hypothetical protein